jgi:ATP phosphoribosyltransferase regulatory subunit
MSKKLLHTPEGVRDVYNDELMKKQKVIDEMKSVLTLYNFHGVETPTFEYFDIFNRDTGSAPSNEMYKLFDRNNNTLVLRPDITPSIARCVAKYYPDESLPIRLSYEGKCFINAHQHQGKLSEISQLGAELINDDSSAADAELIACVVRCLKKVGLTEFQIEIGQIDFFKGLIEEAGLNDETAERIREYIHLKNFFGLSEYVAGLDISDKLKEAFSSFDSLFGGLEMLDKAQKLVTNKVSLDAIDRMHKVHTALSSYGYEKYISFDLSMINRYNYYTGIVFRAYTYGTGDAIVKGGRYNNLMEQFGKPASAIGFAVYIDDLMAAISRNKIDIAIDNTSTLILYKREAQDKAIKLAVSMRDDGQRVELTRKSDKHNLNEYKAYAERMNLTRVMYLAENGEITDFNGGNCTL